jgi:cyclophilin family peptidyl-prolyl cis-trans isomerase
VARNQRRSTSRRTRRRGGVSEDYTSKVVLPGPIRVLTNPKVFAVMGVVMVVAIAFSGLSFLGGSSNTGSDSLTQHNELTDAPRGDATTTPSDGVAAPTPVVKRYEAPPPLAIDPAKQYTATIKTDKGDIEVELYAAAAPETVNSFVFLAREGYYDGTAFMQLAANPDGTPFVAQAGDPTGTGLGTPGYSIGKETTTFAFERGALGMGGTSPTSNGGQFFISYGDYPALDGKYTIFGRVVSGLDVLDSLTLGNPAAASGGDAILSVEINES